MEDYVLKVYTENERESCMIRTASEERLMAKAGSTFVVVLGNRGTTSCDVKLSVGGLLIHTWRVGPDELVKVRRHHLTKRALRFDTVTRLNTQTIEEACRNTSVTAHFYPVREEKCLEELNDIDCRPGEVCRIPDHHIDWDRSVKLSLAVSICDHYLQ